MKSISIFRYFIFSFLLTCIIIIDGEASELLCLNLNELANKYRSGNLDQTSFPLEEVIGATTDDNGDVVIIFKKGSRTEIILSDIVISMKCVLQSNDSFSLSTIGSISPGVSNTNLVYYGVKNSSVGAYMAECLFRLNEIGKSEISKSIEGYWEYNGDYKSKFYIVPEKGQLLVSKHKDCMVIQKAGVKLNVSEKAPADIADWARQFSERYDEVIDTYSDSFLKLKTFFDLCQVLKWVHVNHNLSNISASFGDYSTAAVYTPNMFDFNFEKSIAGGVSCDLNDATESFSEKLNNVRKSILKAKKDLQNEFFWQVEFPLEEIRPTEHYQEKVTEKIKHLNLNDRITFLQLNFNPDECRVFHKGKYYRKSNQAAKELTRLIKGVMDRGLEYKKEWQAFYNKDLAIYASSVQTVNIAGQELKLKPILVLITDELSPDWALIQDVEVLRDNFLVYVNDKDEGAEPWDSIMNFMDQIGQIPPLSDTNFGLAFNTETIADKNQIVNKINDIKSLIAAQNILLDPTRIQFENLLANSDIKILFFDLDIHNKYINLKQHRIKYQDLMKFQSFYTIKLIAAGFFNPQELDWGYTILKSMQLNKAGPCSISIGKISLEESLRRLNLFEQLVQESNKVNIPSFYIPDLILQGSNSRLNRLMNWVNIP